MTQNISPSQDNDPLAGAARSEDPALSDEAVRERRRQERRRLLVGGAAGAGVILTMANRPALAWGGGGGGGGNQCTVSALGSLHPSHPVTGSCGDSPGCWVNKDCNVWADGAVFNGVPVAYTHSTVITTCLPILGHSPFTVTNGGLWNMISQGGGVFSITLANGTNYSILTAPGQQLNIVAAILNNYFYGSLYSATDIRTLISNAFSSCITSAGSNDTNSISSTIDQLCNTLDTLNNQGETCAL